MSGEENPREELLRLLRDTGPTTAAALFDASELLQDRKQLSNLLYNLKKAGEVDRLEDGAYVISGAPGADADGTDTAPSAARRKKRRKPAARRGPRKAISKLRPTRTEGSVLAMLQQSLDATQAAIDEYVFEVGDPKILEPLMRARNEARSALEAYTRS